MCSRDPWPRVDLKPDPLSNQPSDTLFSQLSIGNAVCSITKAQHSMSIYLKQGPAMPLLGKGWGHSSLGDSG